MGYITFIETGTQYADWGALTTALNGTDQSARSTVTFEQTGDVKGSNTNLTFTKGAGVPLVIKAAGFNRTNELNSWINYATKYTSVRPKIDCQGADSGLSLLNLSNITIQGLQITNGITNSSSASMIRFVGATGDNVMEFNDWNNGAIACRYTGSSGNLTIQYNNVIAYGYGAFRCGAGQSGFVDDIGNLIVRRNNFRWNRGYMTIAQRIACGVPLHSSDYTATDASQTIGNHCALVLKNAPDIQVYENYIDGSGQFTMVLENTPTISVERNYILSASLGTVNGGVISLTPNGGDAPALSVVDNLIVDNFGAGITTSGSGLIKFVRNTHLEARRQVDSTAAVIITGNAKNPIFMATSGSLETYNNLFIANPSNNSSFVNVSTNVVSSWSSNYNSYDRQGNTSHFYVSGSIGGTSIATGSLATLQGQGRDTNSKASGGSTGAVTNAEIIRQAQRRLPAPLAGGSIIYPVFNPYACTLSVVDADGCTITGVPSGTVAANSTTNITIDGASGKVPTIALNSLT